MNYRNVRSYDYSKDSDRESPVGSSKTIPDETLSLQELLEKHTRGQYVSQSRSAAVSLNLALSNLNLKSLTEILRFPSQDLVIR